MPSTSFRLTSNKGNPKVYSFCSNPRRAAWSGIIPASVVVAGWSLACLTVIDIPSNQSDPVSRAVHAIPFDHLVTREFFERTKLGLLRAMGKREQEPGVGLYGSGTLCRDLASTDQALLSAQTRKKPRLSCQEGRCQQTGSGVLPHAQPTGDVRRAARLRLAGLP